MREPRWANDVSARVERMMYQRGWDDAKSEASAIAKENDALRSRVSILEAALRDTDALMDYFASTNIRGSLSPDEADNWANVHRQIRVALEKVKG